jgi:hypothetical protein
VTTLTDRLDRLRKVVSNTGVNVPLVIVERGDLVEALRELAHLRKLVLGEAEPDYLGDGSVAFPASTVNGWSEGRGNKARFTQQLYLVQPK